MKIAIAGYGLEGKANYAHWNTPDNELTIVDERTELADIPDSAKTLLGENVFGQLNDFDLVIRTAGVRPDKIKTNGKIWSATNEFFAHCPAPIIGVTGTKGKGTTCSLLASMLRAAGKTVHVVGNIGTPALEVLPQIHADDIVVYELSSFQLWDIERSPHVAVVLMIEADHLDVHADASEYVAAKANITAFQTADDVVVYNSTNKLATGIAQASAARRVPYPFDITPFLGSLQLPGVHNQENASAAIAAAREFGVNDAAIHKGLQGFEGLPHRLEHVRELAGVTYYNDSFSSAPGATIAAIRAFDAPEIVILGGIDKGADFSELARVLQASPQVKRLIIVGAIRDKLARLFSEQGVAAPMDVCDARTMPEIVALARSYAAAGDVVLLSPACASFDMFRDFYDRGDQFRTEVQALV